MTQPIDYDQLVRDLGSAVQEAEQRAQATQQQAMAAQYELTALRANLDMAIRLRMQVQAAQQKEPSHVPPLVPVSSPGAAAPAPEPQPRVRRGRRGTTGA